MCVRVCVCVCMRGEGGGGGTVCVQGVQYLYIIFEVLWIYFIHHYAHLVNEIPCKRNDSYLGGGGGGGGGNHVTLSPQTRLTSCSILQASHPRAQGKSYDAPFTVSDSLGGDVLFTPHGAAVYIPAPDYHLESTPQWFTAPLQSLRSSSQPCLDNTF